jgi:hypothetical protein
MKKFMMIGAALLGMAIGATASATVADTDICLGGVTFGATEAYTTGIYGSPSKFSSKKAGEGVTDVLTYGKGFEITFRGDTSSSATATRMQSTANNGIKTTKGITYGSSYADIISAYGLPDAESGFLKRYFRRGSLDQDVQLIFDVQNDKVVAMYAGRYNKDSLLGLKGETTGLEQAKASAKVKKYTNVYQRTNQPDPDIVNAPANQQ